MLTFFSLIWLHKNLSHHLFSHYNFTPHYNFFNICKLKALLTFFSLIWLHKNLSHHLLSHYNFTPHYNFFNIISFIIITIHLFLSLSLSLFHGLLLSNPQRPLCLSFTVCCSLTRKDLSVSLSRSASLSPDIFPSPSR